MSYFSGANQRPLVAAVAVASFSTDVSGKFSFLGSSRDCSTSNLEYSSTFNSLQESHSLLVSSISDSKLAELYFVSIIRVLVPNMKFRVPVSGSNLYNSSSVASLPVVHSLYRLAELTRFSRRLSDVLSMLSTKQPGCPQLYMYSFAGRVIPADSVESFIDAQRKAGHDVRACNVLSSPHVDHFRNDPKLLLWMVCGVCPQAGGSIKFAGFNGELMCPAYYELYNTGTVVDSRKWPYACNFNGDCADGSCLATIAVVASSVIPRCSLTPEFILLYFSGFQSFFNRCVFS
ncbi:hypothetical protein RYX36_035978 [Vicia faba]